MCHFNDNSSEEKHVCGICLKRVNKNHRYLLCKLCNKRIHIKCNEIDGNTYNSLKENSDNWFCLLCHESIFPFFSSDDKEPGVDQPQFHHASGSIRTFFTGINEFNKNNLSKTEEYDSNQIICPN